MTQNTLTEIGYGDEASSAILNNNFTYLDDKIQLTSESLETTIAQVQTSVSNISGQITTGGIVPTGSIILHIGIGSGETKNIPNGYLVCNGEPISKQEFPALFNVIEYRFGGSGNTFNLPTLNGGQFIAGGTRGDVGTTMAKTSELRNILSNDGTKAFATTSENGSHSHTVTVYATPSSNPMITAPVNIVSNGDHTHTVTGKVSVDKTPPAVKLLFLIKY